MSDKKIFKYIHASDPYRVKIYDTEISFNKLPRFGFEILGIIENEPATAMQMNLAKWTIHETEKFAINKQEKYIIAYADITENPDEKTIVDDIAARLLFARDNFFKSMKDLKSNEEIAKQKQIILSIMNDKDMLFYDMLNKFEELVDIRYLDRDTPLDKNIIEIIKTYLDYMKEIPI